MNLVIDYEHYPDAVEQAIDMALKIFNHNFEFELIPEGTSYMIGMANLAYFRIEPKKELDARKLIYETK